MEQRIDMWKQAPDAFKAVLALETYAKKNVDPTLFELIKIRASMINGCAYCLDMHTKDARAAGETEQRLYLLPAWRETNFYSERERAALAWAEAVTQLGAHGVADALYDEVRRQFDEKALVDLTLAIVAINGWNRLAIGFAAVPGSQDKAFGLDKAGLA